MVTGAATMTTPTSTRLTCVALAAAARSVRLRRKRRTSPVPTESPLEVAAYPALKMSIAAMGEGEELKLKVANDITFPNDIDIGGDKIAHLFGDAAASRPALFGGGTARFFQLWYGAALELRHLVLANGYAQDEGTYYYDDKPRGGAILVYESTLVLIGCVLRSCYSGYYVSDLWDCSTRGKAPCSFVAWGGGWVGIGDVPQGGAMYAGYAIVTFQQTEVLDNEALYVVCAFPQHCLELGSYLFICLCRTDAALLGRSGGVVSTRSTRHAPSRCACSTRTKRCDSARVQTAILIFLRRIRPRAPEGWVVRQVAFSHPHSHTLSAP